MQPEQQQQQQQQQQQPIIYAQAPVYTPEQVAQIRKSNKKKLIWGLVCLLGPMVLLIMGIIISMVVSFTGSSTATAESVMEGTTPASRTFVNILLFAIGGFFVLSFVPGIVAGIILLVKRQKV